MFPFVYGFTWQPSTIIFLGCFFTVLSIVAFMLLRTVRASQALLRSGRAAELHWSECFAALSDADRPCRHQFLGSAPGRICDHQFACDTCPQHAAFRLRESEWRTTPSSDHSPVLGFLFHGDRFYHRGHTWIEDDADGSVRIGLDDIARRMFGVDPAVVLPSPGERVYRNGQLMRITDDQSDVRIPSPIAGIVVERGDFWDGWAIRVRPDADQKRDHLLRGDEVKGWVEHEFSRLATLVVGQDGVVEMRDGGLPIDDFVAARPDANWDAIRGTFFFDV